MTVEDVRTIENMIHMLSGLPLEMTQKYLDLYFKIRLIHEMAEQQQAAQCKDLQPEREPERSGENSPIAKSAAFKRETLDRMKRMIGEDGITYPSLAKLAKVQETDIIAILEGRPRTVPTYKLIAKALDKLESEKSGDE